MNLITPVELPAQMPGITHAQRLLLLGSCFAENIGELLTENSFRADVNPFGILYNPLSIATALREIVTGRVYGEDDLFFFRNLWHSPMHHGSFSSASAQETLQRINNRLQEAHCQLEHTDWLMLTFGTAYVYEQRDEEEQQNNNNTPRIVANCHKLPEKQFTRRRLTVEEIVTHYTALLGELRARCPGLRILLTVSPIRHVRDGLHANQLSKSTLLLAIDRLREAFPERVFYFPSYEIVIDELRDYRFYADDMLHPSPLAVRYLWERFSDTFFSQETRTIMHQCEDLCKALAHRPLYPDSEAHKRFLGQIVLKIEQLKQKYPNLELPNKIERKN